MSHVPKPTKGCAGIKFYLDLELITKIKKTWFLKTRFLHFIDKSRSKQNKKNPEHPFADIIKQKICAKFQQKNIKLYGS